jgi:hypothetical protein
VVASQYDEATVYLTLNGKRDDDFRDYIYKSTDYGKKWTDISGNIPCGPVNVIREDPQNPEILYVGTDLGVYVSVNGGSSWESLPSNLPTTFVHDMIIHPRDHILVAATHGRGMYALDVSVLQQYSPAVLAEKITLFDIEKVQLPEARRWRRTAPKAVFHFHAAAAGKGKCDILDGDNILVSLDLEAVRGLNRFEWDLNLKPGEEKPEQAAKGSYEVRLTLNGAESRKTLVVE